LLCCPMMMAEHRGLSSHIHAGPSETTMGALPPGAGFLIRRASRPQQ
jgi:hypothetical protein